LAHWLNSSRRSVASQIESPVQDPTVVRSASAGTANARPAFVEPALAVLAERDGALRPLIELALKHAGYAVRQCSNTLQLKAELTSNPILTTGHPLLVLNSQLAVQCAVELAMLSRERSKARTTRPRFLLIREFGDPRQFMLPGIDHAHVAGVLEKPFDLDELERLARACNDPTWPANGPKG